MFKTSTPLTTTKLATYIDEKKMKFSHYVQRKFGAWKGDKPSLFIHSLLEDFPIPPVYGFRENGAISILDGKQRILTVKNFQEGKWRLMKNMPSVKIANEVYEIGGLTFDELPEKVKRTLENATLLLYVIEDASEQEIEQVFYRLNNGSPLSLQNKNHSKLGKFLTEFINEILKGELFKKAKFSDLQRQNNETEGAILQSMMLITNYSYKSFGNTDIRKFIEYYKENYKQNELEETKQLFIQLSEAIPEPNKLIQKINIPMFIITLKNSKDLGISFETYCKWLTKFIDEYSSKSEYGKACSGSTTKKSNVQKRINIMGSNLIEFATATGEEV